MKGKVKKLWERDGNLCWLCHEPIDPALPQTNAMHISLDHVVPRKWSGKNCLDNLRLAHQHCNSTREQMYPETMIFTEQQILLLTNPNQQTGGLSAGAKKALKFMHRAQTHVGGELVA
jgi:hypothetical protein